MQESDVEKQLGKIKERVHRGDFNAIKELGFYKIVSEVKKSRELSNKFAELVGEIDYKFFDSRIKFKIPFSIGTAIEIILALISLVVLYLAVKTEPGMVEAALFLLSALLMMTALHPISHAIAGKAFGIKMHFYFLNGPLLIEPTLKTDYASYVKAEPMKRAIFHLAGAINSMITTFFVFLVALLTDSATVSKIATFLWFAFTAFSEIVPLIVVKLGIKKIIFADFRKSDSYRALREYKIAKAS